MRIRRSYVFLLVWVAGFFLGLYLVPGLNTIVLIGVALVNAIIISIFVFGILGIRHRGFGHKAFAVLLILVLVGLLYQNPAILGNINRSSIADAYASEASLAEKLPSGVQSTASSLAPPTINAEWVTSFIALVNAHRSIPLTESSTLDQFATLRYNTIVAHYQISHYGYTQDFESFFAGQAIAGSEEYFQPDASPSNFVTELQSNAPVHWQGLVDPTYTHFGYHLGSGPAYEISQPCSVSEIVGSVNETQLLQQNGCSFSIGTATYFVIELSN